MSVLLNPNIVELIRGEFPIFISPELAQRIILENHSREPVLDEEESSRIKSFVGYVAHCIAPDEMEPVERTRKRFRVYNMVYFYLWHLENYI